MSGGDGLTYHIKYEGYPEHGPVMVKYEEIRWGVTSPPGHMVAWSPGHLVTWSLGHLVTCLLDP